MTKGEQLDVPSPNFLNIMLLYMDGDHIQLDRMIGEWREGPKPLFINMK